MTRHIRILIGILALMILALVGVVALIVATRGRTQAVDYDASMSPTAPIILNTQQLTDYALTQTKWATHIAATDTAIYLTYPPGEFATLPALTLTPSPTALAVQPCGWMWATQFNPELSETLQAEFEDDDHVSLVQAESFGENCLNADGSIRYFAAMQTDFRIFMVIDVPRNDIAAAQTALEPLMLDTLSILADYPPDQTPGPNPGRIMFEIRVRNGPTDGGYLLQVDYTQAMDALDRGLSGEALFEALGRLIERPSMAAT